MQKNKISNDMMLIIMSFLFMFGVGSVAMGLFPAVKVEDEIMYGFDCIFNSSPLVGIIIALGYLLPLIAFVVSLQGAKRKHHKVLFFVSSIISIIGAIIIILEPIWLSMVVSSDVKYAFGPILGFLFALVTAIINFFTGLVRN